MDREPKPEDIGIGAYRELERWEYNGYTCKVRLGMSAYCGYVQTSLPESLSFDDLHERFPIRVHGGLTYGVDPDGWVGFDCGHAFDVCVDEDGERLDVQTFGMEVYGDMTPGGGGAEDLTQVWTLERVRAETERLADELSAVEAELDL